MRCRRRKVSVQATKKIKAVLLDWDGTLSNTHVLGRRAFRLLFKKHGLRFTEKHWKILSRNWGETIQQLIERLRKDLEFTGQGISWEKQRKGLEGEMWKILDELEAKTPSSLFPGVKRAISELKRQKLFIAVVTNSNARRIYKRLQNSGLQIDWIDVVVAPNPRRTLPDDVAAHNARGAKPLFLLSRFQKPRHGFFRQLHAHLAEKGIKPWEAVLVGDTPIDAKAAQVAGHPFMPVQTGPGKHSRWWNRVGVKPLRIAGHVVNLPKIIARLNGGT